MTILEMGAGGGILIAIVLLLRWRLLYRLPKWTFLLLWGVALCRLLVPFTLSSQLSVYTGAARVAEMLRPAEEAPAPRPVPKTDFPTIILPEGPAAPEIFQEDSWTAPMLPEPSALERESVSPMTAVYLTGTALCVLFFGAAYLWSLRRFWDAVPAEGDFLRRWREEHPTLFPVRIRVSGAVNAPLAYGLIRPVILLPENTDWTDERQLTCVLTHEYVHIRRGDLFWKLLLAAALCVHWFNPLVWAMYFCANQDLELACDERVVRILGLENRKGYACALLSAAESRPFPLCITYTTRNHMEERIRAIMKMKKRSLAAVLTAALLVAGVTAVFATSKAPEPKEIDDLPQAVMSNTDPRPAPGDKSAPGNRVHPVAPGDTSTPDGRIHPVAGQPGGTPADASREPAPEKHVPEPEKQSAYPVNSKGQTYGLCSIVSPENCIPDLINVPFIKDGENDPSVACFVRKEDAAPYRYPGEINNPDDAVDYMAWMAKLPYDVTLPAYDKEGNSLGTTEVLLNYDAKGGRPDPTGMDLETAREEVKNNRWNVPADPIPRMTEIRVATEEELKELRQYLTQMRGIREGDMAEGVIGTGGYVILITYEQTEREERLANGYPVNSKGETYGNSRDSSVMGYEPDLIAVQTTSGKGGYAFLKEIRYGDYQGETETLEGRLAFGEWKKTQPSHRLVKVYDADRNNIIGYFPVGNGMANVSDSEELEMIATQLRNWGLSEEKVAEELGYYKQIRGMW